MMATAGGILAGEREKVGEEGQIEDNGEGGAAPREECNGEQSSGGASGLYQPAISSGRRPVRDLIFSSLYP